MSNFGLKKVFSVSMIEKCPFELNNCIDLLPNSCKKIGKRNDFISLLMIHIHK